MEKILNITNDFDIITEERKIQVTKNMFWLINIAYEEGLIDNATFSPPADKNNENVNMRH